MDKPRVLVIPPPYPSTREDLFARSDFKFVERAAAESDPSAKQVIPYIVVSSHGRILAYRRSTSGGEARLFDRSSIGWGGHIEEVDRDDKPASGLGGLVHKCARRELQEELSLGEPDSVQFLGIIDDDSEPVGQVHLGYVELWHYEDYSLVDLSAHVAEADTASRAFWIDPGELDSDVRFEAWSIHALAMLAAT